MAGNVEFVRDRRARVREPAAERLAGFGAQPDNLGFKFLDAGSMSKHGRKRFCCHHHLSFWC